MGFSVIVRQGRDNEGWPSAAEFGSYEDATAAAADLVAEQWDYTTTYAFVGAIRDDGTGRVVADIEGQYFSVIRR